MSFIDSPISRCEAVREMVLTDQTQASMCAEHGCPPGRNCPLDGCFAEISGVTGRPWSPRCSLPKRPIMFRRSLRPHGKPNPRNPSKLVSAVPTKDQERLAA